MYKSESLDFLNLTYLRSTTHFHLNVSSILLKPVLASSHQTNAGVSILILPSSPLLWSGVSKQVIDLVVEVAAQQGAFVTHAQTSA